MKLDFEKAYDRVSWAFLDKVLTKKGFGKCWRRWIRGCISNAYFSVLVNGAPRYRFSASRGLRQGDPLSSFLFTLMVDILTGMLDQAFRWGLLRVSRLVKMG